MCRLLSTLNNSLGTDEFWNPNTARRLETGWYKFLNCEQESIQHVSSWTQQTSQQNSEVLLQICYVETSAFAQNTHSLVLLIHPAIQLQSKMFLIKLYASLDEYIYSKLVELFMFRFILIFPHHLSSHNIKFLMKPRIFKNSAKGCNTNHFWGPR